ncbi:MAG TPA: sulfite exporter TauE/SafE family protein [Rhodocyclaceae bacterium]|nr:sulfite exporter TauE/SafE family protein [Rhodocyclaceae bacterium]
MPRNALLAALAALALVAPLAVPAIAQDGTAATAAPLPAVPVSVSIDKTQLDNGGVITVSGAAEPGKPVYLEIWNENKVRGSFFDNKVDKETGVKPNKLYIANDLPAFYRIVLPKSEQEKLDKAKAEGKGWSYSAVLKDTGGDIAYWAPSRTAIASYQTSMGASMSGQRGDELPALDDKNARKRSMQIMKSRFRSVDKLLVAGVEQKEDGSFTAQVKIPEGAPPGKYLIVATTDKKLRSMPATVENNIAFPMRYMSNAGTSLNIFIPFLVALALATFGVLMGAGGGFIINPVLLMLFPLPHNVVAGTVTPTVLFSQGSGVANYSRIKFISWKVGIALGLATLAGAFIGPALTDLITLDEFKFVFGWILFFLAALMFWQTTPGYVARNKKEQAILKEFQKRAEEAATAGA